MTRPRVLVADDDSLIRLTYSRVLRKSFNVTAVANGAEALTLIRTGERFSAIILDLDMPVMDGREAYEKIVALHPSMAERILIVSGGASTPELGAWLAGFEPSRRFSKPIDLRLLWAAISKIGGHA